MTFGVSSAPFLATQTLNRIAREYKIEFPEVSEIIRSSFYVNDFAFSFDTIEEGLKLRDQLRYILASSQMPMRKWSSNSPDLIKNLPLKDVESTKDESAIIKTLGLVWNPESDEISFAIKPMKEGPITKASVLSEIASIYDPIGLIGPVILRGKLHMKPLRTLKWMQELPEEEKRRWNKYRSRLLALNDVTIPRHALIQNPVNIQLHGFSDASEEAYGAVIYLRSSDAVGNTQVSLVCSKSRVSPPKQKTIARLELCAATLLSKLMSRIEKIFTTTISDVTMWSDSMIVLYWIASESSRLSTFVGHRVAVIQELSKRALFKHIRGELNPADIISRGLLPEEIKDCLMWWFGPHFLATPMSEWPKSLLTISDDHPEITRELRKSFFVAHDRELFNLIETRFSNVKKLINFFAFIRRLAAGEMLRNKGNFSVEEIDRATLSIIRIVQQTLFPLEFKFFTRQLENPALKEIFPQNFAAVPILETSYSRHAQ